MGRKTGSFTMAFASRSRTQAYQTAKPAAKTSAAKAEEEFLASVMTSVSASLETMSEKEREKAIAAAEKAVAHLR